MDNPTAAAPQRRTHIRAEHALVVAVVAVLVFLAVVPIGFLVWRTFVVDGSLTLDSFREAYSAVGLWEMALELASLHAGHDAPRRRRRNGPRVSRPADRSPRPAHRRGAHSASAPHSGRSLHDLVDLPREPAYGLAESCARAGGRPRRDRHLRPRRDGARRGPPSRADRVLPHGGRVRDDRPGPRGVGARERGTSPVRRRVA